MTYTTSSVILFLYQLFVSIRKGFITRSLGLKRSQEFSYAQQAAGTSGFFIFAGNCIYFENEHKRHSLFFLCLNAGKGGLRKQMIPELARHKKKGDSMSVKRIKNLVKQLNEYRHAYYNQDAPLVSDAEYDRLFDELKELEEQTGFILSNSPTQTVGYYPVSELAKVTHPIPLLSLEKTKLISELLDFMKGQEVLFMLKLDGLTTKLIYEDGRLIQASTRGDGEVGEDITHNIPAFLNVPLTIPHKERLVITGESFIPTNDFERLKDTLRDGNGKPYKNGRNFASGSVRSLDPKNCIGRCVRFLPFNVLEGMEDVPFPDSRACKLEGLTHLGFGYCPFFSISGTGLSKRICGEIHSGIGIHSSKFTSSYRWHCHDFLTVSATPKAAEKPDTTIRTASPISLRMIPTKLSCVKLNGHRPDSERLLRSASSIPWRLTAVMFPELPFII